jgi:hypothetical protein
MSSLRRRASPGDLPSRRPKVPGRDALGTVLEERSLKKTPAPQFCDIISTEVTNRFTERGYYGEILSG